MWINPEKHKKNMRLDIGSGNPLDGENQPQGYVLQDVEAYQGIDLVCDILELPKHIEKEYCSEIRASHVIEHFGTNETDMILQLLSGLLKKGGLLNIIVPNFKWHASLALAGEEEQAVYYAFGGQLDEWDFHKTGFTPTILTKALQRNNFKIIKLLPNSSIECLAVKL